jgi:hypothetical protein
LDIKVDPSASPHERLLSYLEAHGVKEVPWNLDEVMRRAYFGNAPHVSTTLKKLEEAGKIRRHYQLSGRRHLLKIELMNAIDVAQVADDIQDASVHRRIENALAEHGQFPNVGELMKAIVRPNENLDLHTITGHLRQMSKHNQVKFDLTRSGKESWGGKERDGFPVNIRLTKMEQRRLERESAPSEMTSVMTVTEPAEQVETEKPEEMISSAEPVEIERTDEEKHLDIGVIVGGGKSFPRFDLAQYPLISQIVNRESTLRQMYALAVAIDDTELALQIDEKIDKPMSPLEAEIVRLYQDVLASDA